MNTLKTYLLILIALAVTILAAPGAVAEIDPLDITEATMPFVKRDDTCDGCKAKHLHCIELLPIEKSTMAHKKTVSHLLRFVLRLLDMRSMTSSRLHNLSGDGGCCGSLREAHSLLSPALISDIFDVALLHMRVVVFLTGGIAPEPFAAASSSPPHYACLKKVGKKRMD
ncbi:hypothetical protein BDV96DRAFT_605563 [Lophiotrema nucula]|uniref:Uncharacterized protein n=1 Tax=Lophiotrema nucula TaxID=690887 RepID=A0A6A5YMI1_9PLEO|nr:hypothetical protein BDV96DRAFT_605563 [Lophiotrema nucula]